MILKNSVLLHSCNAKFVVTRWCKHFHSQQEVVLEQEISNALKFLIEPITKKQFRYLGAIQGVVVDNAFVKINLDLFVAGYPYLDMVQKQFRDVIANICDKQVLFNMAPMKKFAGSISVNSTSTLSQVGHVIAVSSCKGGVGKSTVAVNLALAMSMRGLRVGLLDADVYGPSLPQLIQPKSSSVLRSPKNPKHIMPLESAEGGDLKILSFGHVNPKSGAPGSGGTQAAVMRGPIVTKVITQLMLSTEWGDLDYLLIDMPPGTGDVQITVTQSVPLTGAVLVTTPHSLSLSDTAKGFAMFESLQVPTLAVVENMSYFTCDHGTKYFPFGSGGRDRVLKGISNGVVTNRVSEQLTNCSVHSLPFVMTSSSSQSSPVGVHDGPNSSTVTSAAQSIVVPHTCSSGCSHEPLHNSDDDNVQIPVVTTPIVMREPGSESASIFRAIADDLICGVFKTQLDSVLIPAITHNAAKKCLLLRYFTSTGATEFMLPVHELRVRDPVTGDVVEGRNRSQFAKINLVSMDTKGKYGVSFLWSDDYHTDIFPYHILQRIAEECR